MLVLPRILHQPYNALFFHYLTTCEEHVKFAAFQAAHAKLDELRSEHARRITSGSPGLAADISAEEWWKPWPSRAQWREPLHEIIAEGVV